MKRFRLFQRADAREQIASPVGTICSHCGEEITGSDSDLSTTLQTVEFDSAIPQFTTFHLECHLRMIAGSVRHQRGECSCVTGDDTIDDDSDYPSKREAARAAAREFLLHPDRAATTGDLSDLPWWKAINGGGDDV